MKKAHSTILMIILLVVTLQDFSVSDGQTSSNDKILVSITKNSVVYLSSQDLMVRAHVEIADYSPIDGDLFMKIVKTDSGETVSESKILVRQNSGNIWSTEVGYMVNNQNPNDSDSLVGPYEIQISPENGAYEGSATFSVLQAPLPAPKIQSITAAEPTDSNPSYSNGDTITYLPAKIFQNPTNQEKFGSQVIVKDDLLLATASDGIYIYELNSGKLNKILRPTGIDSGTYNVLSPTVFDGKNVLTHATITTPDCSSQNVILHFDYSSGKLIRVIREPDSLKVDPTVAYPSDPCSDDFGYTISLYNNIMITSGSSQYVPDYNQKEYVFLYDLNTGKLVQTITDPNEQSGNLSAWSVAHNGKYLVVGAGEVQCYSQNYCHAVGRVYIFDFGSKTLLHQIKSPKEESSGGFGPSLLILGDDLFVGSLSENTVYHFNAKTGELIKKFEAPKVDTNFGYSVSANDNNILIGAPYPIWITLDQEYQAFYQIQGRAYLYEISTGKLIREFKNPVTEPTRISGGLLVGDNFGGSVSIDDKGRIAISAWNHLDKSLSPVFVFLPSDSTMAPKISVPENLVVTSSDQSGSAKVDYKVKSEDSSGVMVPVKCNPPPNSAFAPGKNEVSCTATDSAGNTSQETFIITVTSDLITQEKENNEPAKSKVPDWIKSIFIWYGEGKISEDELDKALQFLIQKGIIKT